MSERTKLPKKLRFDVFNRDGFICQYCGRRPPAVVLEVDHIIAIANGGTDDRDNLITSCFDCNRGKGVAGIEAAPIAIAERAELIQERMDQVRAYEQVLAEQREHEDARIDEIVGVYERAFQGWTVTDSARASIRNFLKRLTSLEVFEAMELACSRMNADRAFRYFCGVCWNKIRDREGLR